MIRLATASDTEAIAQLWEKLVAYHRALDPDLPDAATNGGRLYAQRLSDRMNDSHTRIFVAVEDGQVVGYVLGVIVDLVPEMFQPEIGGFLADIYVDAPYRGRGIGRDLVETLMAWFQERQVRYVEWFVASKNADAQAFWTSLGGRDMMIRMRINFSR
ncbi:MAG: GNAT family N-acetyltransferase [Anaerolineae bacterium]|jgi:ribosomal protein S18 acetylase RimI-like enzyme|nr:GNAT family N-acetyltransferase [Anaerolineae bacterium]